jgi:hypothetical protein
MVLQKNRKLRVSSLVRGILYHYWCRNRKNKQEDLILPT